VNTFRAVLAMPFIFLAMLFLVITIVISPDIAQAFYDGLKKAFEK